MNQTLKIQLPSNCKSERQYIVDHVMRNLLGLEYELEFKQLTRSTVIQCDDKKIVINDALFSMLGQDWLDPSLMDRVRVVGRITDSVSKIWCEKGVPVLGCEDLSEGFMSRHESGGRVDVNFDLFGICFFIISRYEEFLIGDRDQFDRFGSSQSILRNLNILDIPIVDVYAAWLGNVLKSVSSAIEIKQHSFDVEISCDVDHLYHCGTKNFGIMLRKLASDCLVRKNYSAAVRGVFNYVCSKFKVYRFDDYLNSLYWMMDVAEENNHKIQFNFIAAVNKRGYDGCYDITEPIVKKVLGDISLRGHLIGVHPSFETYNNPDLFHEEVGRLKNILEELDIDKKLLSGRQHYLRASRIETFRFWSDSELQYDSTLGYSDATGYRCGTTRAFKMYDVERREIMRLEQRPLNMMECVVIKPGIPKLEKSEESVIADNILQVMSKIEKIGGTFSILWHNSEFKRKSDREIFATILSRQSKNTSTSPQ